MRRVVLALVLIGCASYGLGGPVFTLDVESDHVDPVWVYLMPEGRRLGVVSPMGDASYTMSREYADRRANVAICDGPFHSARCFDAGRLGRTATGGMTLYITASRRLYGYLNVRQP